MGIRLSVMRVNTNKSPCSQVAWRKRGGSCCPINLIMSLLPEGPRRLPERATRAAQYVGVECRRSTAPNSRLPFLFLFDLRFICRSQWQILILTDNARDDTCINGTTAGLRKLWKTLATSGFISIAGIVHAIHLTPFAWSHKCLAEMRSTSYSYLCIIPHRELRQSSGALSDVSIKSTFFLLSCLYLI